jgi:AcrR family transcriptional regulator
MQSEPHTASDPAIGPAARAKRDPAAVRRDILAVAREHFVEKGLSGARVDEIAARTATSKRMIYYYYGDKEGLYRAVLENAYAGMRAGEAGLELAALPPREAMARLVGYSFDYHAHNPHFVRLVMVENIHHARHLAVSEQIARLNLPAIGLLRDVYGRGVTEGVFRAGLDPLDLHFTITAPAFYNVSNRASIREVFGHDMGAKAARENPRASVVEMVLRFVAK